MKKTTLLIILILISCVSFAIAQEPEEYNPEEGDYDWEQNPVMIEEGGGAIIPSDYIGTVEITAGGDAEIPEGYTGEVQIKGGSVTLPNGEEFKGTGTYSNGELIIDDGEFRTEFDMGKDGTNPAIFKGSGSYADGKLKIKDGELTEHPAGILKIKSTTSTLIECDATGECSGVGTVTDDKGRVLKTDKNTVFNTLGEVKTLNGRQSSVSYTLYGGLRGYMTSVKYDIALTGKRALDLQNFDWDRFEIDISEKAVSEISVDGVSYKGLDDTSKGSPYMFSLMMMKFGDEEVYHSAKVNPPKGIGLYEGVIIEGGSNIRTHTAPYIKPGGQTSVSLTAKRNAVRDLSGTQDGPDTIILETPETTVNINRDAGAIYKDPSADGNDVIILADNTDIYDKYRIKPPSENPKKPYTDPLKKLKQDMLRDFIEQLKQYGQQPTVFDDTIPT